MELSARLSALLAHCNGIRVSHSGTTLETYACSDRLGDHKMFGDDDELEADYIMAWLQCAQTIADTRKLHDGQKVLYYVISDSKRARDLARGHLGDDKVKCGSHLRYIVDIVFEECPCNYFQAPFNPNTCPHHSTLEA